MQFTVPNRTNICTNASKRAQMHIHFVWPYIYYLFIDDGAICYLVGFSLNRICFHNSRLMARCNKKKCLTLQMWRWREKIIDYVPKCERYKKEQKKEVCCSLKVKETRRSSQGSNERKSRANKWRSVFLGE